MAPRPDPSHSNPGCCRCSAAARRAGVGRAAAAAPLSSQCCEPRVLATEGRRRPGPWPPHSMAAGRSPASTPPPGRARMIPSRWQVLGSVETDPGQRSPAARIQSESTLCFRYVILVAVVDSWYIGHGQGLKVSHCIMIMPVARSRARSISASTESPIILSTVPDAGTFKKQPTNYSLIVDHVSP